MKCWYDPSYSSNEKIWCKRISEDICKPPVRNDSTGAEKLRFFIDKYTGSNYFLVILRDLKMSDSGIYYCMIIGNSSNSIILRTIHLVVSAGELLPSIWLSAFLSHKAPELERTQETASSSREVLNLWVESPTGVSYQIFTL